MSVELEIGPNEASRRMVGDSTKAAIREFQRSRKLIADGYPDAEVLAALGVS